MPPGDFPYMVRYKLYKVVHLWVVDRIYRDPTRVCRRAFSTFEKAVAYLDSRTA